MNHRLNKVERQEKLANLLYEEPFTSDEELSKIFVVSIQTIRLDRMELGIPELRERTKQVAEHAYAKVRSVPGPELTGDLQEIELGDYAVSFLNVVSEMVGEKNKVCRGDYIFAQANSLASALIDADIVLTGSARIRFRRPVYLNEKIVAHAVLARKKTNKYLVKVVSKVGAEEVFVGKFVVVAR